MGVSAFLEPGCNIVDDLLLVEGDSVVNDEDLAVVVLLSDVQPLLVLEVDLLQVVQWNVILPLAVALLDSLLAGLGAALHVDDAFEADDAIGLD